MTASLEAWHSSWDLTAAGRTAESLHREHGAGAKEAALHSALEARAEQRGKDYRFWLCVLCVLHGVQPTVH